MITLSMSKSPRLATAILFSAIVFGCQANSSMTNEDDLSNDALLERGPNGPAQVTVNAEEDTLSLRTVSTGCTRAEHFHVRVDAEGNYSAERIKRDRCRRKPFVVTFEYSLQDLPN